MKRHVTILVVILSAAIPGFADAEQPMSWGALEPGDHRVGFRLIEATDHSRAVRPESTSPRSWPRPVRIYLWYPAEVSDEAASMTFGRYADLVDADVWPEAVLGQARERMAFSRRPIARSLGAERFEDLRAQPMGAVENAAPAATGIFPLVVVAQGLYYESPVAHAAFCENLASHGFVVATTPLVGTNSALVNLDVIDLETQVRDLEFIIAHARTLPFVNLEKLAAFGFDMGGMSALVLAMRNPDVDALATTDAAVLFGHPAGIPESSHHYDPSMLRCPWFHATQRSFGIRPEEHDGPDLFSEAVHSDRTLLLVEGMGHWDFTSYALVEERDPIMGYWPPRQGGEKVRYGIVCRSVIRFLEAHLANDSADRPPLSFDLEEMAPGMGFTVEHRAPTPPVATYSDFLNALVAGKVEAAIEMADALRTTDPDGPLLQEAVLNRLGYHLIASWELFDAGIAVFELNAELHPESVNVYDSLGEGFIWKGDDETAIGWFRKVLELDPENERAKRVIERLQRRSDS